MPGFQTATAISATRRIKKTRSPASRVRRAWRRFVAKLANMDPVKLAYLRTSFVFAISVLVTWTPSSINRVYTLIHPESVSYALNVASAAVLPLQGVWNAVIYFTTSAKIVRQEYARWKGRAGGVESGGQRAVGGGSGGFRMGSLSEADRFERAAGRRRRPDSDEVEMESRAATRVGTVRVQKGCELDG